VLGSELSFNLIGTGCHVDSNDNRLLRNADYTFKPYNYNTSTCLNNLQQQQQQQQQQEQQHFYDENTNDSRQEDKEKTNNIKDCSENDAEQEHYDDRAKANEQDVANSENLENSSSLGKTKSKIKRLEKLKTTDDHSPNDVNFTSEEATRISSTTAEYLMRPPDSESIAAAAATASANRSKRRTRTKFSDNQVNN
jgi:hypothetical protein